MRYILLFFLFFAGIGDGLKKATLINNGVKQAGNLYNQQQFQRAAKLYRFLNDSLHLKDSELLLNLAHASYHAGQKTVARKYYQRLRDNANPAIQAAALNQLGLLSFTENNPEKALYYFKKAILQDPQNDIARYNFELVQKFSAENPIRKSRSKVINQKQLNQKVENQPQNGQKPADSGITDLQPDLNNPGTHPRQSTPEPNPGQTAGKQSAQQKLTNGNLDQVNKGQAGGPEKGLTEANTNPNPNFQNSGLGGTEVAREKEQQLQTLRQRLSKTDLTPEKANMLLEAMRLAELQYLQQLPHQPTRHPDKSKPDW
jgi:tetratricopeptide (TPR) repeat protein